MRLIIQEYSNTGYNYDGKRKVNIRKNRRTGIMRGGEKYLKYYL